MTGYSASIVLFHAKELLPSEASHLAELLLGGPLPAQQARKERHAVASGCLLGDDGSPRIHLRLWFL